MDFQWVFTGCAFYPLNPLILAILMLQTCQRTAQVRVRIFSKYLVVLMPNARRSRGVCCCRVCKGKQIRDLRTIQAHYEKHGKATGDDGLPDPVLVAELNHLDDLEVDPEQEPPFVGDWEPAQAAAEPLWEESMFSDIDFSVWLGHLATKYSIPRDAVDELLHGFRALLEGTENNIPKNWNQLFQKLKQYGVPVMVYDVCQDDCVIFRREHSECVQCPVCSK